MLVQKMFQKIAPIFALAMMILGITCPGVSQATEPTGLCRSSLGPEIYGKFGRICDECSSLFKVKEVNGLCRGKCFSSEYFEGCWDILDPSRKSAETLSNFIDIPVHNVFDRRSHEEGKGDEE